MDPKVEDVFEHELGQIVALQIPEGDGVHGFPSEPAFIVDSGETQFVRRWWRFGEGSEGS